MKKYYTNWEEAVKEAQRMHGEFDMVTARVSSISFSRNTPTSIISLEVDRLKKERKCDTVHVIFTEPVSRFELLDL